MLRYFLKRLLSLVLSLIAASIVIFLALEVVPGDPAAYMLGLNAQEDTLNALRDQLGLNGTILERYLSWAGGLLAGDFGVSYTYRTPVAEMIGDRLWVSLPLALYALTLSTLIAFPAGIWAASRRGSLVDTGVMGVTQLGVAIPNFWFAMLMVLVFAINLRWFSAGGFPGWDSGFWAAMKAADPSGDCPGSAAGQHSDTGHALQPARYAQRGFHSNSQGERAEPKPGLVAARLAQCPDPGPDHHGAAVFFPAGRRHHH